MSPLIILGVSVLIGAFFLVGYFTDQKRTQACAQMAIRLGSLPLDSVPLPAQIIAGLPLCKQGSGRRSKNVFCFGKAGHREFLFDYRFSIGSGQNRSTLNQTVFLVETTKLPEFNLRPEGFFDKLGDLIGLHDIDFEDSQEFSKKYVLKGKDQSAIKNAFSPPVRQLLLRAANISVECAGGGLIIYRSKICIRPEQVEALLREAREIASILGCHSGF